MNNYIDERLINHKRPQIAANRYIRVENGKPLTRKTRNENIFMQSLRVVAAIFLLLLSTFGGDGAKASATVEKAVKNCMVYAGILLALWGVLVLMSNLINAVTLLPMWCLILGFAVIVLGAAGVLKK